MSNVEAAPRENVCGGDPAAPAGEVLEPREVPLGGPRAMTVRRTLPQRRRSLVGAWCFVDHYGPETATMAVPGHPHTGLQTVSWLVEGEIEHRDTTGAHALVRPGELNLMTAGAGIAHSEHSLHPESAATTLHGVQLWIALPDRARAVAPSFDHHVPAARDHEGATVRVLLGSLVGDASPAPVHSPLVGAEIVLPPGRAVRIPVEARFEHAVLVDTGRPSLGGRAVEGGRLAYVPPGSSSLELHGGADGARVLLLGGEPLGEEIVMWWNFVGRDHDEIVAFRERWETERADPTGAFGGAFPAAWSTTLPAPALPGSRLRPRR